MSEALEILKSCDAFLEGHFLLSSGRHSSAYCQMAYLQQYPDRCAEVMKAVADKIREMDVDVIVGPAMGGIVYAYIVIGEAKLCENRRKWSVRGICIHIRNCSHRPTI